ncbi:Heptaprenyl diphosphate synthase component I [Sporotomaculum syntrophicum]|uniref:Heptaprenyl diphosphate synthase component I n=1 Tax=Sporotomaculum syntrophicum TaxID=182264 RepID=A0A9D3AYK4_9FIRM|nr:Gx transporter family protein [Sporotomaculum syntrophicum]KAF1085541.1 Heptaprenyl diphosphate synthase component I [Sporotomaculum syntrophicum]
MSNTKRLVIIALFIALATALNIVERFIPLPIAIPGVKLGLANTVTLLAILMLGWKDVFLIVTLRCLLAVLYGGNPVSFLFSITGGLFSALIMVLTWRYLGKHISIVTISLLGAVAHNIGQLFVAALIIQDFRIYVYLPVLLVSALITGYIVGVVATQTYKILLKIIETEG